MDLYYISCLNEASAKGKQAGSKAVVDIESILQTLASKKIKISALNGKRGIELHLKHAKIFKKKVSEICGKEEHCLFIQMPVVCHSVFLACVLKQIRKENIKVVLLLHDLEFVRGKRSKRGNCVSWLRTFIEEISMFKQADALIVHNTKMKKKLMDYGIKEDKMVELEIFDYLIKSVESIQVEKCSDGFNRVVIAGNLTPNKCGYVYDLPAAPQFLLYGANYVQDENSQDNIHYMGSYMPDELVNVMQGDLGLGWDGDSAETCAGPYGQYLRYNNPHKTSLYLACGMPVIIWEGAALAYFIIENNVGITVSNLNEIAENLSRRSKDEYIVMKKNAEKLSKELRTGFYFKAALNKCIKMIEEK